MKEVSQQELYDFVKNYPNPLSVDNNNAFGCYTWNDFTLGKWPKSVVAIETMIQDKDDTPKYKIKIEK